MLGAIGSWSPPSPSTFSPELQIDARLPGPWTTSRLSIPAYSSRMFLPLYMLELLLEGLLLLGSEVRHSSVKVPRLLFFVLEALYFFCACLQTLQTSSQVAWLHVHELLALLGSIPACGFHVEVQGFVNHASRLHVSCGCPGSRFTEPSCEGERALVCRDTTACLACGKRQVAVPIDGSLNGAISANRIDQNNHDRQTQFLLSIRVCKLR